MFGIEVDKQIEQHALSEFPKECCGVVLKGNKYQRLNNVHSDPENAAMLSDADTLMFLLSKKALAFVHSHTKGDAWPTAQDMHNQLVHGVPYGIVTVHPDRKVEKPFWFGDTVPVQEFIGREFKHGVADCYALFRDWYKKEFAIRLGMYPRDHLWWEHKQNLFSDFYRKEGFEDVSLTDLQVGDGLLFAIGPHRVMNHIGIYVGNGLMMHHLFNRLSRIDPVETWSKFLIKAIRHRSKIV